MLRKEALRIWFFFDPKEEWKAERFPFQICQSPFLGRTMKGKIHYTICAGQIIYEG